MSEHGTAPVSPLTRNIRTDCPKCHAPLAIVYVVGGRTGAEYWTMRCRRCGAIHLDIVKPTADEWTAGADSC